MEKPKRNSQQRPFFSLIFIALVFTVGFGLGFVALNIYENATDTIVDTEPASTSCLPNTRDYVMPVVVEYDSESTQVAYTGGAAQGGGNQSSNAVMVTPVARVSATSAPTSAVQMTATALSQVVYPSPEANMATGGQNAAVATSVVSMEAAPLNVQAGTPIGSNASDIMVIPGTYTPAPMGTTAPQMQGTAYPATTIQTDLINPLSAGEIDDNAEWNVYLSYRRNFQESGMNYSPITDIDVYRRLLIQVVDEQSEGILGATVEVRDMQNRLIQTSCTYADGFTMFLPNAYPETQQENTFRLHVSKNGRDFNTDVTISSERFTNNFISIELDTQQALNQLDILFLIDATGSMDDEIAAITNNILYISEEIDTLPDAIDVRYALVSFKDPYYPTQVWDFTSDVTLFQSQLATLYTAGGDGETLNDGLDRSIHQVHWRGDDTVKLVFMIGDEIPGVYAEHPSYSVSMMDALYAGIKIHPIASSGLDLQGEYIFRQVAQATMGNFIFLSYDNGASTAVQGSAPAEGSVAEEPAGQYSVDSLHEIVLNLIREELGFEAQQE